MDEYIKVINQLAFMIHEAQYDLSRWDNDQFISSIRSNIEISRYLASKIDITSENSIVITTTILGDIFEYNTKLWDKKVNGILIYKINSHDKLF